MKLELVFVTGNPNKLKEVKKILELTGSSIRLISKDLDLPELQGPSTREISIEKVKSAVRLINGPCITEDTALCFKALNGLPGPYIKWFLKDVGLEGLNKMLQGFTNKEATALCTFSYIEGPGMEPIIFEGSTSGKIVEPRGTQNFGWDSIFEVEGTGLTYAEMTIDQKNELSHRSKALSLLCQHLSNL
ncbi:inosine triphosphatase [Phakopsora pachyrhizi]|nr:inosine triphosphatase [Phakopsora pachyrhizi]